MKTSLKATIAALAAVALATAPAVANANQVYFLVGTRHVFRIGTDPYLAQYQRQALETQYADNVAAAKSNFDSDVNNGVDPAVASDTLNQRLSDAASARDFELSQYYVPDDQVLNQHPELSLSGDGPYQVIGINVVNRVWSNFVVLAPWSGYRLVGPAPYGWVYGRVYDPYAFHAAYLGWYHGWVAGGAPVFVGLYGGGGFLNIGFSASINIGLRANGFAPGPGYHPGGFWQRGVIRPPVYAVRGFRPGQPGGGFGGHTRVGANFGSANMVRPASAFRPAARPGGSFGGNHPAVTRPNAGSFRGNRPAATRPNAGSFGGNRPASRPSGSFGGNRPASRPTGSFGGNRPASRPSGSFGGNRPASRPSGSFGGNRPASRPSGGGRKKHGG